MLKDPITAYNLKSDNDKDLCSKTQLQRIILNLIMIKICDQGINTAYYLHSVIKENICDHGSIQRKIMNLLLKKIHLMESITAYLILTLNKNCAHGPNYSIKY